jgi:hypothetical protein
MRRWCPWREFGIPAMGGYVYLFLLVWLAGHDAIDDFFRQYVGLIVLHLLDDFPLYLALRYVGDLRVYLEQSVVVRPKLLCLGGVLMDEVPQDDVPLYEAVRDDELLFFDFIITFIIRWPRSPFKN